MNIFSLIDQLGAADAAPDAAPRRSALGQLGRAAAALLPVTLAAPQAAQASPQATSYDALVILLQLEELQIALYTQALNSPGLTAQFGADLNRLRAQQTGHAAFLRQVLTNTGAEVPPVPAFDFSGRRNNTANPVLFPNVFTDAASFLNLAQQIEDAGVGIYKSQAAQLTADVQLLDAVLRMHTVEARHAAHLRTLRRASGVRVKSWPSASDAAVSPAVLLPALPPAAATTRVPLAGFETNTTQLLASGTLVPFPTLLAGTSAVQYNALAEAFDEPLPTAQALAFLNIFS